MEKREEKSACVTPTDRNKDQRKKRRRGRVERDLRGFQKEKNQIEIAASPRRQKAKPAKVQVKRGAEKRAPDEKTVSPSPVNKKKTTPGTKGTKNRRGNLTAQTAGRQMF